MFDFNSDVRQPRWLDGYDRWVNAEPNATTGKQSRLIYWALLGLCCSSFANADHNIGTHFQTPHSASWIQIQLSHHQPFLSIFLYGLHTCQALPSNPICAGNLSAIIDVRAVYTQDTVKGVFGTKKKKKEQAELNQMGFAILPVWDHGERYVVAGNYQLPLYQMGPGVDKGKGKKGQWSGRAEAGEKFPSPASMQLSFEAWLQTEGACSHAICSSSSSS